MSCFDLSGCKKRKRGDRIFKFKTFGEQGSPVEFTGSFLQNIRALLELGHDETGVFGAMASWSFQLEVHRRPLLHVFLFVIEEPIELSLDHVCKHCQYMGWGHHMICNKKYHFVLPSKDGALNYSSSSTECKLSLIQLEGHNHTMHGVFHSNGFGHLLSINGLETGSDLAGYQIMDFWDRLCTGLGARKVSLKDVSQKKCMDLRLLHAVAYGKTWFSGWGYTFGRGSFGITKEMYQNAVETIQNLSLGLLAHPLQLPKSEILIILSRYQTLSGNSLVTLGDLVHFMLELKGQVPRHKPGNNSTYPRIMSDSSCRWSSKRVEIAIRVVIESLKRAEFKWVSRQEVRDSARAYIGDTGLLDFVLKSLGNHVVGKYFIRRCLNPVTKVLEYCLEDISHEFPKQEGFLNQAKSKPRYNISWTQLMKDVSYLYAYVLNEHVSVSNTGVFTAIHLASRIILDTKYFVKEYCTDLASNFDASKSKLYCAVVLTNHDECGLEEGVTPYECFVLNKNATFDELNIQVQHLFSEIYLGLRNFVAEDVTNLNPKGSDLVFQMLKPGGKLVFRGMRGEREITDCGMLCGSKNLLVDCVCGTKDDDGERMVACDICEVWQHTRCVHIQDCDEIPSIFLCNTCEQDILRFAYIP